MNLNLFVLVLVLSIIVEAIMEYVKKMVPEVAEKTWLVLLITCAIGIFTAISFGIDLFELMGVESKIPYVGCVLTGILCARGSNYMYDLIGKFTDLPGGTKDGR